jgi:hypothetical protein
VQSLLPRIKQFGLATASELALDALVARMEAEAVASRRQLSGSSPVWCMEQKILAKTSKECLRPSRAAALGHIESVFFMGCRYRKVGE